MGEYVIDEVTGDKVSNEEKKRRDRERDEKPFKPYINTEEKLSTSEMHDKMQMASNEDKVIFVKTEGAYRGHRFVIAGSLSNDLLNKCADRPLQEGSGTPELKEISDYFREIRDTSKEFHEYNLEDECEKRVEGYLCSNRTAWDDLIELLKN